MDPNDASPLEKPQRLPSVRVPIVALDALRTPLAVILAHAQMQERRMRAGVSASPDGCLAAIGAIERAVWELERQLRALQEAGRGP
jgi:hypothetical protein